MFIVLSVYTVHGSGCRALTTGEGSSRMHTLTMDSGLKQYGQTAVVNHLSLIVKPDRVTGFLGPNGAGKSTGRFSWISLQPIVVALRSARTATANYGARVGTAQRNPV